MVSEANLDEYKKVANEINTIAGDQARLEAEVNRSQQKLVEIRSEIVSATGIIRDDFDDILKEVMQGEWLGSRDLRREEDQRSLRIYLKKTLKRLGM